MTISKISKDLFEMGIEVPESAEVFSRRLNDYIKNNKEDLRVTTDRGQGEQEYNLEYISQVEFNSPLNPPEHPQLYIYGSYLRESRNSNNRCVFEPHLLIIHLKLINSKKVVVSIERGKYSDGFNHALHQLKEAIWELWPGTKTHHHFKNTMGPAFETGEQ